MHEFTPILLKVAAWAYKAAVEHEGVLSLLALAFIMAMPAQLPGIFGRVETLQWGWQWLHDGLKTVISLQRPNVQETKVTETRSVSVELPNVTAAQPPITITAPNGQKDK